MSIVLSFLGYLALGSTYNLTSNGGSFGSKFLQLDMKSRKIRYLSLFIYLKRVSLDLGVSIGWSSRYARAERCIGRLTGPLNADCVH